MKLSKEDFGNNAPSNWAEIAAEIGRVTDIVYGITGEDWFGKEKISQILWDFYCTHDYVGVVKAIRD